LYQPPPIKHKTERPVYIPKGETPELKIENNGTPPLENKPNLVRVE